MRVSDDAVDGSRREDAAVSRRFPVVAQSQQKFRARPGDAIVISGHHVGEAERSGEILDVLGSPGSEHYHVRWEDGRESVFYPSNDARVRPAKKRQRKQA
jgi:hypothetical protein